MTLRYIVCPECGSYEYRHSYSTCSGFDQEEDDEEDDEEESELEE